MTPASRQQADDFTLAMTREFFPARIVRKGMAFEMQWLASGFDILRSFGVGVPTGSDFLNNYSTTLGPFVYMPDSLTPDQVFESLPHELTHVKQFMNHPIDYSFLWIAEPEARAEYEAWGYRASMEIRFARTKQVPDLDEYVEHMRRGYALDEDAISLARGLLSIAVTSVAAGVVSTEAGQAAVRWMRANAPELLA